MSHSSRSEIQAAYNFAANVYSRAFEMNALLVLAREDERELFHLLLQAQEKANAAVTATREVEQALAQLLTIVTKDS